MSAAKRFKMSEIKSEASNNPSNIEIQPSETVTNPTANESDLQANDHNDEATVNILDLLNDDCIISIFEYLSLRDLCNVADVCIIFRWNAVSVFKRTFADFDFTALRDSDLSTNDSFSDTDDTDYLDVDEDPANSVPMEWIEKVFRHFGTFIHTIHLYPDDFDDDQIDQILELMASYCADENSKLKKLVMQDITIDDQLMERIRPVFNRLETLDVTGGSINIRLSIGSDSELTELKLQEVDLNSNFSRTYEKLQKVTFIDIGGSSSNQPLRSFATSNQQIKSLTLIDTMETPTEGINTNIYSLIDLLPELEELTLLANRKFLYEHVRWEHLVHLKLFNVDCSWLPIERILKDFAERNVPLEVLELRNVTLNDDMVTSLAKLNKTKSLTFSDAKAESGHLSNVVSGMPELETLCLFNFEPVTMKEIKETIGKSTKLSKVQIHFENEDFFVFSQERTSNETKLIEIVDKRGIKLFLNVSGSLCQNLCPVCMLKVQGCVGERNSSCLVVQVLPVHGRTPTMDMLDKYVDSDKNDNDEVDEIGNDEVDEIDNDEVGEIDNDKIGQ